jgi:hypothetical protein
MMKMKLGFCSAAWLVRERREKSAARKWVDFKFVRFNYR